jgi:hypothetical protein
MTTYSDLVTLLLCFFVLLFSFSVIDAKKFEAIIRSFQGSLGVLDSGKTIDEDLYISQALQSDRLMREQLEAESLEWLYRQLDEYIKENALEATVVLGVEERGLLIRFRDQVLFDSGKAIIRKDAETIVQSIGEILKQYDRSIRVEGHTDNVPMNTFCHGSTSRFTILFRRLRIILSSISVKLRSFMSFPPLPPSTLSIIEYVREGLTSRIMLPERGLASHRVSMVGLDREFVNS